MALLWPIRVDAAARRPVPQLQPHHHALYTPVPQDKGGLAALAANASGELTAAVALGPAALLAEHTAAVLREHGARVEVTVITNSSLRLCWNLLWLCGRLALQLFLDCRRGRDPSDVIGVC